MRYENLSAVRKYELRTVRKTKREFKKEVDYLNHLLNMFLRTLKVIDEKVDAHREFTNSEKASFRLSFRIFRIIRYAFNSSLEGYYDVSMALLRIALENHLLQIYLGEHENEAKLWFKGKRFSPAFLRKNANWSKFFYRELSEFVHSSFESTFIFTRTEEGWEQGLLGEYNGEQFKNILFLMTIIFFSTMLWLLMIFKFEFAMNEEWRSFCWGKFIEITKYIRSETKKAKKPKKEENPES